MTVTHASRCSTTLTATHGAAAPQVHSSEDASASSFPQPISSVSSVVFFFVFFFLFYLLLSSSSCLLLLLSSSSRLLLLLLLECLPISKTAVPASGFDHNRE